MDGVEFAAGGAEAAADAAVVVHGGGAAAKAALCLGLDLFFRQGQAQVLEGLRCHARLPSGDLALCVVEFLHHDIVLVEFDETAQVSGQRQGIAGMDETVDGLISLTARRDGVDGEPGSRKDVAAHEDIRLGGLAGDRIGDGRSVPVQLHSAARKQFSPFHGLADGKKHVPAGKGDGILLVVGRIEAPLFVPDGCALLKYDADRLSIFCQDLPGPPAVHDGDALFFGLFHFVPGCGHLLPGFQADHGDLVRTCPKGRPCHVHGHVAAAYHNGLSIEGYAVVQVDFSQEFHAGHNAFRVLAGNAGLSAVLGADGHVEGLIAFAPEFIQGDVLSDLHPAADLHAHLADDVDLGFDHVLFQAEAGDAVHQHAAGPLFLLEDRDGIAVPPQIVGRGQAGGAGAHNGDLLGIELSFPVLAQRDVAVLGLQIQGGDIFLDLVDGQGLIDGAPGAGVLAPPVADGAADGGEGIILLDQLQGLPVAALGSHLYIALDGQVGRAGTLAGSRAGGIAVYLGVVPVVVVPLVGSPGPGVRELCQGIGHGAAPGAELLAQFGRAHGADLHALAAGHALILFHVGPVGGCGHVGGVEELGGAQGVADAGSAVADGHDLVFPVDVGDLMDIAVALGPLQGLDGLVVGDVAAHAPVHGIFRQVPQAHAVLALDLAAALSPDPLLLAAGADADGDLVVFPEPVGDVLHGDRLVFSLDGLLHGNDVHADAGASGRYHLGDAGQGQLGHEVEEGGHFRELVRQLVVHHHEFRGAGDKDGHVVHLVVGLLPAADHLHDADPAEPLQHLFGPFQGHAVHLCQFLGRIKLSCLFEGQAEGHLLLGQDMIQGPVFRISVVQFFRIALDIAVRDHVGQLQDHFFLLGILGHIVRILKVIPFVDHRIAGFPLSK